MKNLESGLTATLAIAITVASLALNGCKKTATIPALRAKQISLTSQGGSPISGVAVFKENRDHSTNIEITLQQTVKDTIHVVQIDNGTVTAPGNVAISLNSIKGTGGQAKGITANVRSTTNSTGKTMNVTYDQLITYPGSIIVYYSVKQPKRIVATAKIR